MMTPRVRFGAHLVAVLLALMSVGCSTLLPTSRKEVVSDWSSYDQATRSLVAFEPYRATRTDVHR